MRNNILMFFLAALMMSGAWAETVYKCRNPQGDLVYQETPCKQDAQSLKSWSAPSSASGCVSIVAKLAFGPFRMRDVPVAIAPNLTQPLLGMNVLQQFRIEQEGGELRLSPKD